MPHPDDHVTIDGAMYYGIGNVEPSTEFGLINLHVWPGVSLIYVEVLLFAVYFLVGLVAGIFTDVESFRNLYLTDPSSFYIIARLMSVAFGVGTVWTLYHISRRLYNHRVGLMAALFLSASFLHSFHSQFIRPDIPTTFFALLTILYCLKIVDTGKQKYYVYAGIFTGLAIATKFTSGILLLPILIAHIMHRGIGLINVENRLSERAITFVLPALAGVFLIALSMSASVIDLPAWLDQRFVLEGKLDEPTTAFLNLILKLCLISGGFLIVAAIALKLSRTIRNVTMNLLSRQLVTATLVSGIVFLVFDPIFILKIKDQLKIFIYTPMFMGKNVVFAGAGSIGTLGNLWWYITGSLRWGAGLPVEIMSAAGILTALYLRKKEDILILVFPALYLAAICSGHLKWERWMIPLMPFMALYSAGFLYFIVHRLFGENLTEKTRLTVLSVVSIAVITVPVYNILRYDYMITHKDTRTMAKEWIESNIPHGSKIGQDQYTGKLSKGIFDITKKYSLGSEPYTHYVENGYEYLIVSDTQYSRFLNEPDKFPVNASFYSSLFEKGELIKEFIPRSDLWPKPEERFKKYHIHFSPEIKVYKIQNL